MQFILQAIFWLALATLVIYGLGERGKYLYPLAPNHPEMPHDVRQEADRR